MKKILITGAATGIGAATARLLAPQAEALVLHTGSNHQNLQLLQQEITACKTYLLVGDLSLDTTFAAIQNTIDEIQGLDVLISNAGFPEWSAFGELTQPALQKSLDINVKAFYQLITQLMPWLQKSACARVIATSSFLAHRFQLDDTYVPAASASKAALEAMVKSLAMQLAPEGIPVNAIVPGYIKKDGPNHKAPSEAVLNKILSRIPMARLGLPDEVAALVQFLISESAAYITGQAIAIDGGLTV